MTTMRQGIGGAPRLRCARAGLVEDNGDAVRRRAVRPSLFRARAPGPSARAVVRPCSAAACAGPDAGGQEARTVARRGVLLSPFRGNDAGATSCCSALALRARAPGHPHRAANSRRIPAMERVPQSTGPSGEKR